MKNKLYKILFCACFILSFTVTTNVKAQTTIYNNNFDSASVVVPGLPTAWVATTLVTGDTGWVTSNTNSSYLPSDSGGYPGASGKNNIEIANDSTFGGTFTLTSSSISTVGYDSIKVIYGARRTKHFADYFSAVTKFAFSTDDGITWDSIPFVDVSGDSDWHLINDSTPMALPVSAANRPSVLFQWTAKLNESPSGTYRIDDFKVMGSLANGISEYKDQNEFKVYIDNDNFLHLTVNPFFKIPSGSFISVTDIIGRTCLNEIITGKSNTYSLSSLKQGVYLVKIAANDVMFAQKIVCH